MLEIEFHSDAEEELLSAAAFYESRRTELGEVFLQAITNGLDQIKKHPLAWATLLDEFHRYLIHQFPYAIVYRIEEERIFVLAIAHSRRRPKYWQYRN